jgi:hypothetical protein
MLRKFALVDLKVVDPSPATGISKWAHRHVFNYEPRRGYLYVRSRAISSRTNDNWDTFPAEELKLAWKSFIGRPVFVNHNNQDHRRNRGVIIDAALHEDKAPDGTDDTWVEVLMEVDAKNFPRLALALINHEIERTSMGVDVEWSICSFCGNKAKVPSDYCPHIKRMKGQRLRRKNASTGEVEDVLVHEICAGLSFFENSLLVEDPADPTAYTFGLDVRGILDEDGFADKLAKVASFKVAGYGTPANAKNLVKHDPPIEVRTTRAFNVAVGWGIYMHNTGDQRVSVPAGAMGQAMVSWDDPSGERRYSVTFGSEYVSGERREGAEISTIQIAERYLEFPGGRPDSEVAAERAKAVDPNAKCPMSGQRLKSDWNKWYVTCPECGAEVKNTKGNYGSHKPRKQAAKTAKADPGGWHVYGPFPPTKRSGPVRYSKNWMVTMRSGDVMRQFLFATEEAAMAFVEEANNKPFADVDQSRVLYASKTAAEADWVMPSNPVRVKHRQTRQVGSVIEDDGTGFVYVLFDGQEYPEAINRIFLSTIEATSSKTAAVALDEAQRVRFKGTGVDKDDDGYYCKTHRCRSDSYPSIDEIPDSVIEFIESTGAKMKTATSEWQMASRSNLYGSAREYADGTLLRTFPLKMDDWHEGYRWLVYPDGAGGAASASGEAPTIEEAQAAAETAAGQPGQSSGGVQQSMFGVKTGSIDLGLPFDVRVPAQIETLRPAKCPVCESNASWNFDGRCDVCGYLPPPKPFREPDTDVASRTDQDGGWFNPELTRASPFKMEGAAPKLPKGWRVEMIGLAESVQFTSPGGNQLLWGDGEWMMGNGRAMMKAPGVPRAKTMAEARTVGTNWIIENWQDDDGVLESNLGSINPVQPRLSTGNGQRPIEGVSMAQESVATAARRRIAADRALAEDNARLRDENARLARLVKRADTDNPAQPVAEPGAQAAAPTSPPAATIDVTNVGGVIAPPDLSAGNDVTKPGGVMPAAEAPSTDVEAPVAGGSEIDPKADGTLVPTANDAITENAFGGDWASPGAQSMPATAAQRADRAQMGRVAAQVRDRIWASVRLARLRIRSGISDGVNDDLELGRQIEGSKITLESIQAEASALHKALQARPPQQGTQQRVARRAPSLAAGAQPSIGLAPREADEMMFE